MLDLLGLLSKSAPNVHAFTSLDQNPLVYKVKLWHTEALKTANFLKIRIAVGFLPPLDKVVERLSTGWFGWPLKQRLGLLPITTSHCACVTRYFPK